MKDDMHGVSNTEKELAILLFQIDGQDRHLEKVKYYGTHKMKQCIKEWLENVNDQSNDTALIYSLMEWYENQEKMKR